AVNRAIARRAPAPNATARTTGAVIDSAARRGGGSSMPTAAVARRAAKTAASLLRRDRSSSGSTSVCTSRSTAATRRSSPFTRVAVRRHPTAQTTAATSATPARVIATAMSLLLDWSLAARAGYPPPRPSPSVHWSLAARAGSPPPRRSLLLHWWLGQAEPVFRDEVPAAGHFRGPVLLLDPSARLVVGIAIAVSVSEPRGARVMSVPKLRRGPAR